MRVTSWRNLLNDGAPLTDSKKPKYIKSKAVIKASFNLPLIGGKSCKAFLHHLIWAVNVANLIKLLWEENQHPDEKACQTFVWLTEMTAQDLSHWHTDRITSQLSTLTRSTHTHTCVVVGGGGGAATPNSFHATHTPLLCYSRSCSCLTCDDNMMCVCVRVCIRAYWCVNDWVIMWRSEKHWQQGHRLSRMRDGSNLIHTSDGIRSQALSTDRLSACGLFTCTSSGNWGNNKSSHRV